MNNTTHNLHSYRELTVPETLFRSVSTENMRGAPFITPIDYQIKFNFNSSTFAPPPPPIPRDIDWKFLSGSSGSAAFYTINVKMILSDYEDSILRQFLACIPLIGIAVTFFNERSLRQIIAKEPNLTKVCHLIDFKNEYKLFSMVRTVSTVALIITEVAGAVLSAATIGVAIFGLGCVAAYAYTFFKNRAAIEEINKTGHFLIDYLR